MMQLSESLTHEPSAASNMGLFCPFSVHAGASAGLPMLAMTSGAAWTKMSKSFVAPAVVWK
jgi:hypothetical protein